jgi:hypothetical protein
MPWAALAGRGDKEGVVAAEDDQSASETANSILTRERRAKTSSQTIDGMPLYIIAAMDLQRLVVEMPEEEEVVITTRWQSDPQISKRFCGQEKSTFASQSKIFKKLLPFFDSIWNDINRSRRRWKSWKLQWLRARLAPEYMAIYSSGQFDGKYIYSKTIYSVYKHTKIFHILISCF